MLRTATGPLLIALSLAGPPAFAADAEATALLDAVLAAYGGAERLAAVKGFAAEGSVVASVREKEGTTTRLYNRPDALDVSIHYTKGPERRIVIGDKGWRGEPTNLVEVAGPPLDAMVLHAARVAVPWVLDDHRDALSLAEPLVEGDKTLPGLTLSLAEHLHLAVWFDPDTHLAAYSRSAMTQPMEMSFGTRYGDYREVDGLWFAFSEETNARGMATGTTVLTALTLDPEAVVAPPAAVPE